MLRIFAVSILFSQTCFAASIISNPVPADLNQLNQSISEEASHASVDLSGKGADLKINYSSPSPLSIYILFLNDDGSVNPREIVSAELPKGTAVESLIPLSQTRGWSWGERKYKLHFLTDKGVVPAISKVEISGSPSLIDGIKQFFALEPFTPSSYHRLSGYKLFGISFTLALTLILIILLFFRRKKHVMNVIIILILLFNVRFSMDLLRYTKINLSSDTYSTAGSAYQIADYFKSNEINSIQLCSDGNTYFPTILKYAGYPLSVNSEADHVLIRNAFKWSFENGNLTCGDLTAPATQISKFPDGSILFKLSK